MSGVGGVAGAGLGLRPELAADLLRAPSAVDFLEVVAESCFVSRVAEREALAFREIFPVVPHGVKLSLGGAEAPERERLRALGRLARRLRAPLVSEHVAFVRGGGREVGHLVPVPRTRAALGVVARNVDRARRSLPDVPFLLENPAATFEWPDHEMSEGAFLHELLARCPGVGLLLDLSNLWANATNAGRDPLAALLEYPLQAVGMVHLAGGDWVDGYFLDDHAHAVGAGPFALLEALVARTGAVPVLVERDAAFPPFEELAGEVALARGVASRLPRARESQGPSVPTHALRSLEPEDQRFADAQRTVCRWLTDVAPPAECFDPTGIARTRAVLLQKRIDEALPLLQELAPHRGEVTQILREVVRDHPRPPRLAAYTDALRAARAAADRAHLRRPARLAAARIECRFRERAGDGALEPRRAPHVTRALLGEGDAVWLIKGPGAHARPRFVGASR